MSESVEVVGLASRARLLFYLQAMARLVMFWVPASLIIGGVVAAAASLMWGVVAGGSLLFLQFVIALWYPALAFDRWGYALREHDLLIQRGVLWTTRTAIPTNRIQHVDTQQGPIEQWLGLARVQISTASGMGADGVIPGLDAEVADALRDALVQTEGDDGV